MIIRRMTAFCLVALLLAVGAEAKDRPRPKPETSTRATGCAYLGEGYIKAEDSDTCIKVSGSVRAEGAVSTSR